jgi:hypothetical protein
VFYEVVPSYDSCHGFDELNLGDSSCFLCYFLIFFILSFNTMLIEN